MSNAVRSALVAIPLLFLVAGLCFARRWREFAPEGEGFTVSVPAQFAPLELSLDPWAGPTGSSFYEARAGSFRFVVGRVDLLSAPADEQVLRTWSYNTWMAVGRDANAGMQDDVPIAFAGASGREARGRSEGDRSLIVRVAYVAGTPPRMLLAAVEAPASLLDNGHAERFLSSFAAR